MAPKAEKKPAKKVAKSTSSAAAKKRKLAKAETYKIYIYKVLKQVCVTTQPLLSSAVVSKRLGVLCACFHSLAQCLPAVSSLDQESLHTLMLYRRCTRTPASAPRQCPS